MSQSLSLPWPTKDLISPRKKLVSLIDLSNQDLVIYCQTGDNPDRQAFQELLRRHQSHVNKLLYHLAPDWSDRADLSQEVWIRVYRNIKKLKEPVKFKGWLSRIVTNLFYDELRKRKRRKPNVSLDAPRQGTDSDFKWELPDQGSTPKERLSTQEFYDQLQWAINQLPDTFRTTIILREIDDLSYEDIADITNVSLGTVKSRIARARLKLQSILKDYMGEE